MEVQERFTRVNPTQYSKVCAYARYRVDVPNTISYPLVVISFGYQVTAPDPIMELEERDMAMMLIKGYINTMLRATINIIRATSNARLPIYILFLVFTFSFFAVAIAMIFLLLKTGCSPG